MRRLERVRLVAGREIRARLRGRAWYISTALMVIGVLAVGVLVRLSSDDGLTSATVGISAQPPTGFADALAGAGTVAGIEVDLLDLADRDDAEQAVDDDTVDAALVRAASGQPVVLYTERVDPTLQAVLQAAWATSATSAALVDAGVPAGEVDHVLTDSSLDAVVTSDDAEPDEVGVAVGLVAAIVLFIGLQMYGAFILMGVIEEKSSAVIEVLLARVHAIHLLAGKVVGIGTVALAQLAIGVVAAVVALRISGVEVPASVWTAMPSMLVWFLGGFVMYAFLYAMAGAMVSRQEDAQTASLPVTMLLLIVYLSIYVFASDPDQLAARVLSLVPPFTPLLMPLRMATGSASVLEIVAALVLMVATTAALAVFAARIYTNLVLRRGGRITWLDAIRSSST